VFGYSSMRPLLVSCARQAESWPCCMPCRHPCLPVLTALQHRQRSRRRPPGYHAAMIEIPRDAPGSVACGRSGLPLLATCSNGHRRLVPLVRHPIRPGLDAVLLQQECRLAATSACRVWSGRSPRPWWLKPIRRARTPRQRAAISTSSSTWPEPDPAAARPGKATE
jgi:hypothetical protein